MTSLKGQYVDWRLVLLVSLLRMPSANGQYYENEDTSYKHQPPSFNDPIRHVLGLWSRLLNRMSQTNEPTDDQLHLRINDGDRSAFENLELPSFFGNLNQRRDKNARVPPIQSLTNSIINEERLNQLLPRTGSEQKEEMAAKLNKTVEEKTTVTTKDSDKEENSQKTDFGVNSKTLEDNEKLLQNDTFIVGFGNNLVKAVKPLKNINSPKRMNTSHSDRLNEGHNISDSKTTNSNYDEAIKESIKMTIGLTTKTTIMPIKKSKVATTTTAKPSKAADIKSTKFKLRMKAPKTTTVALSTDKPSTTTVKIKKTQLKASIKITDPATTTSRLVTPTTELTTELSKKIKSNLAGLSATTMTSRSSSTPESYNDFESSGEEPLLKDEEELLTVEPTTKTVTKKFPTNKSAKITFQPNVSLTRSTTIKFGAMPTSGLKTTTPTPKTALQLTTAKSEWQKGKIVKNEGNSAEIPEAEEAEFQTDDQPVSTLTPSRKIAEMASTTGDESDEESQENEKKMEKMLTPVSSIIDGIGPLILPLLGYSRQTIGGILNPGASASAAVPASATRVAGTRIFQPQKAGSNAQIARSSSTANQHLESLTSFQHVMTPFQNNDATAFQQAPTSHKTNGPKQSQVKNHVVEQVSLSPTSYYNNRKTEEGSTAFVQTNFGGQETAEVVPVGQNPTFNKMINADTSNNGYVQRFIPNPSSSQQQKLSPIDQATMVEVYRQILSRKGLRESSLRGVNENQLVQIAQLTARIPKNQNQFISINAASPKIAASQIRRQPSIDDPGYQMGRSNVINSFYEDSGLMVGTNSNSAATQAVALAPSPPNSNSISSKGFGGGRQPDSNFEQVALTTLNDERLI